MVAADAGERRPGDPERQAALVAVLTAAATDGHHLAATLGAAAARGIDPTPDEGLFTASSAR